MEKFLFMATDEALGLWVFQEVWEIMMDGNLCMLLQTEPTRKLFLNFSQTFGFKIDYRAPRCLKY